MYVYMVKYDKPQGDFSSSVLHVHRGIKCTMEFLVGDIPFLYETYFK